MKKIFKTFILGILAGGAIGLGSFAYVCSTYYLNNIFGSIIFSIGLLLVCFFELNLFTGKVGKVLDNKPSFFIDLLIMYLGNFVGAVVLGLLVNLMISNNTGLIEVSKNIAASKIYTNSSIFSLFISSIFCGMLVYLAVEFYKRSEKVFLKVFGLVICVTVFVLCGFSHCIANMFYLSLSLDLFNENVIYVLLSILVVTLGNSFGAIILNIIEKLIKELSENKGDKNV